MNLATLLEKTAEQFPDKTAMVDAERVISYGELWALTRELAEELRRAGVGPGRMVGLRFPNSILFVALTYALWLNEAVVVPIPMEMREEEACDLCATMGLAAAIRPPKAAGERYAIAATAGGTREPEAGMRDLHAAFVRFTSGTTSASKGVVLTHESIRDRIAAANRLLRIGPDDAILWFLSMAHHFVVTIVTYLWRGATIVLAKGAAGGGAGAGDLIRRHGVTLIYASPFHFEMLTRDANLTALPSVRLAISTATALPGEIFKGFHAKFGIPPVQAYGIIEVGLACVNADDPAGRPGSVGRPLPDFRVKLENREAYGADGERGEVLVAGPGFFDAYYHPWKPAKEILENGWFRTGDVGRVDADGFVFLESRANSVINVAGMKVFPEEVERALNRHPAVAESRVYGRKHAHLGEIVEAEVTLRAGAAATEAEIRRFCGEHVSSYKAPNAVHFVMELPRTAATGKLRRGPAPEEDGKRG